jgi:arsenate reductase (thioredoxin)
MAGAEADNAAAGRAADAGDGAVNVLFLCTGNSAHSIFAGAILNELGAPNFKAWSAGSQPKDAVHPLSLDLLRQHGHDIGGLRSKSWDEFALPGAPELDFVFTVCDNAANEACPVWLGHPASAHWGIPDPAAAEGSEAERRAAFRLAYERTQRRIVAFVALPIGQLNVAALENRLAEIGEIQD